MPTSPNAAPHRPPALSNLATGESLHLEFEERSAVPRVWVHRSRYRSNALWQVEACASPDPQARALNGYYVDEYPGPDTHGALAVCLRHLAADEYAQRARGIGALWATCRAWRRSSRSTRP